MDYMNYLYLKSQISTLRGWKTSINNFAFKKN